MDMFLGMNDVVNGMLQTPKRMGSRKSVSREAIRAVLASSREPISVHQLMDRMARKGKVFNKTTVYRELEILKRLGSVRELFLRNDVALYELAGTHHHHAVCVSCGNIQHIDIDEPKEWSKKSFLVNKGFIVLDHSLEFFGMCRNCQSAS